MLTPQPPSGAPERPRSGAASDSVEAGRRAQRPSGSYNTIDALEYEILMEDLLGFHAVGESLRQTHPDRRDESDPCGRGRHRSVDGGADPSRALAGADWVERVALPTEFMRWTLPPVPIAVRVDPEAPAAAADSDSGRQRPGVRSHGGTCGTPAEVALPTEAELEEPAYPPVATPERERSPAGAVVTHLTDPAVRAEVSAFLPGPPTAVMRQELHLTDVATAAPEVMAPLIVNEKGARPEDVLYAVLPPRLLLVNLKALCGEACGAVATTASKDRASNRSSRSSSIRNSASCDHGGGDPLQHWRHQRRQELSRSTVVCAQWPSPVQASRLEVIALYPAFNYYLQTSKARNADALCKMYEPIFDRLLALRPLPPQLMAEWERSLTAPAAPTAAGSDGPFPPNATQGGPGSWAYDVPEFDLRVCGLRCAAWEGSARQAQRKVELHMLAQQKAIQQTQRVEAGATSVLGPTGGTPGQAPPAVGDTPSAGLGAISSGEAAAAAAGRLPEGETETPQLELCDTRRTLHRMLAEELIRQVAIDLPERGVLLRKIVDEYEMTVACYDEIVAAGASATLAFEAVEMSKKQASDLVRTLRSGAEVGREDTGSSFSGGERRSTGGFSDRDPRPLLLTNPFHGEATPGRKEEEAKHPLRPSSCSTSLGSVFAGLSDKRRESVALAARDAARRSIACALDALHFLEPTTGRSAEPTAQLHVGLSDDESQSGQSRTAVGWSSQPSQSTCSTDHAHALAATAIGISGSDGPQGPLAETLAFYPGNLAACPSISSEQETEEPPSLSASSVAVRGGDSGVSGGRGPATAQGEQQYLSLNAQQRNALVTAKDALRVNRKASVTGDELFFQDAALQSLRNDGYTKTAGNAFAVALAVQNQLLSKPSSGLFKPSHGDAFACASQAPANPLRGDRSSVIIDVASPMDGAHRDRNASLPTHIVSLNAADAEVSESLEVLKAQLEEDVRLLSERVRASESRLLALREIQEEGHQRDAARRHRFNQFCSALLDRVEGHIGAVKAGQDAERRRMLMNGAPSPTAASPRPPEPPQPPHPAATAAI